MLDKFIPFGSDEVPFNNKGLRYKLLIVESLIFVIPFFVFFYLVIDKKIIFDLSHIFGIMFLLIVILGGLLILRDFINQFFAVASIVKKSDPGELAKLDFDQGTAELRDITQSFARLVSKFEDTSLSLERRVLEIFTLKELIDASNRNLPAEGLLNEFLMKAMAVTGARVGSVLVLEGNENLKVLSSRTPREEGPAPGELIPVETSLLKLVVKERMPLLVEDIEQDPRTRKINDPFYGSPSFLSMPVITAGEVIGVINLSSKKSGDRFHNADEQIISIMLGEIDGALERVRLQTQVEKTVRDLEEKTAVLQQEISERRQAEESLKQINSRFQALLHAIPDLICFKNPQRSYVMVNRAFERIVRKGDFEIIGKTDAQLFETSLADSMCMNDGEVLDSHKTFHFVQEITDDRGEKKLFDSMKVPIFDNDGTCIGLIGVSRDITERKQVEALYETLAMSSPIGVYMIQDSRFKFMNPRLKEAVQYSDDEILTIDPFDLVHPDDHDHVRKCARDMLKGKRTTPYEYRMVTKQGDIVWVMESVIPVYHGGQLAALGNSVDITARRTAEEALKESERRYMELSITDDLTKLYNSRHFYVRLRNEVHRTNRYDHPLSLLLLDLDDFKKYNDTYGHVEGDLVLIRLGEIIRGCIRESDTAYRYGGEEFMVILPETIGDEAVSVAERIRVEFEQEPFYPMPEHVAHVTVSVGVTQYTPEEEMIDFVKRADRNMYIVKERGKNKVFKV